MGNRTTKTTGLVKKIGKERSSKVITYFLGDKKPFPTRIANDAVPIIQKHLSELGKTKKISLFLYTSGGDLVAPVRLVNLIREHTKEFEVLVPNKCHSAGTLLALGANKIVMGSAGELSPIDPSTTHPFNPKEPKDQRPKSISVEDVNSYFLFAKEQVGLESKHTIKIFEYLVNELHPLALGNIYRGYRMALVVGERLLSMHMDPIKNKKKIKQIIRNLTKTVPIHGYPINRREAKDLGLKTENANKKLDVLLADLVELYSDATQLNKGFNPQEILKGNKSATEKRTGAIIESEVRRDEFIFNINIQSEMSPSGKYIPKVNLATQWEKV